MEHSTFNIPLPEEVDKNARDDAMGAYLMMFASLIISLPIPFLNIIAALIYFIVMSKKSPFVRFHSLQSFISQCIVSIFNSILVIIFIVRLFEAIKFTSNYVDDSLGNYYDSKLLFTPVFTEGFKQLLLIALILNLLYLTLSIIAAVQAHNGKIFSIWGVGYISKKVIFSTHEHTPSPAEPENTQSHSNSDTLKSPKNSS